MILKRNVIVVDLSSENTKKILIVGNGFDLSLNLKTKYSDFMLWLIKSYWGDYLEFKKVLEQNYTEDIENLYYLLDFFYFDIQLLKSNITNGQVSDTKIINLYGSSCITMGK